MKSSKVADFDRQVVDSPFFCIVLGSFELRCFVVTEQVAAGLPAG